MKRIAVVACLFLGFYCCMAAQRAATTAPRQIFYDNFANPATLTNGVNWVTRTPFDGSRADPLHSGASEGEHQIYVGTGGGYGNPSPFSFTSEGLSITAQPIAAAYQPLVPTDAGGDGKVRYNYTSGCLVAVPTFRAPMYTEATMRAAKGSGMWSVGEYFGYPMKGVPEIDFFQVTGKYPKTTWDVVYSKTGAKVANIGASAVGSPDLTAAFHKYGVEFTTTGQNFFVDRKQVGACKTAITQDLLLTFNLSVGDTWAASDPSSYTGIPNGATGVMTIKDITVWDKRPW